MKIILTYKYMFKSYLSQRMTLSEARLKRPDNRNIRFNEFWIDSDIIL